MESSSIASHGTQRHATADDHMDVPKPVVKTVLIVDFKSAEDLDFDEPDLAALCKTKKDSVPMCVGITSNVLRVIVSNFNTAAAPNMSARPSFSQMVWLHLPHPQHVS